LPATTRCDLKLCLAPEEKKNLIGCEIQIGNIKTPKVAFESLSGRCPCGDL